MANKVVNGKNRKKLFKHFCYGFHAIFRDVLNVSNEIKGSVARTMPVKHSQINLFKAIQLPQYLRFRQQTPE